MGIAGDAQIPAAQIATVKMRTTVATNALLNVKAPVVLITNEGLFDWLSGAPKLFDRAIRNQNFYASVEEVPGRWGDGRYSAFDPAVTRAKMVKPMKWHAGRCIVLCMLSFSRLNWRLLKSQKKLGLRKFHKS